MGDLGRLPRRPAQWENAGGPLVDNIFPYEQRKLWLLNASHSLLAYAGSIRGSPRSMRQSPTPSADLEVEPLWDAAVATSNLPADMIADYRAALLPLLQPPGT